MSYVKEYWTNKEKRAKQAINHTEEMWKKYGKQICISAMNTKEYHKNYRCIIQAPDKDCKIIIDPLDSVSAILKYKQDGKRAAVLNFSSYKNPGGMFINGSKAQEECLCHESYLYNVLSQHEGFYSWNNENKNKSLYFNRALYTPDVLFFRSGDEKFCDVITCAAPNKSAAQKYQGVSNEENTEALKSRINFVLDIAKTHKIDTLILGAYGCGVFGQDSAEVASIFKHCLATTHNCFENVVFAIPEGRTGNYEAFADVFGDTAH